MVKVKDYIEHLGYHYSNPDQYLTCSMCNVYKHISLYRFRNRKCKLISLYRLRSYDRDRMIDACIKPSLIQMIDYRHHRSL